MKKRILATLLTIALACTLALTAQAADSDFDIQDGVLVKYTNYNHIGMDVVIPDGVTKIGKGVFQGRRMNSVTIPNGVIEIDKQAFQYCRELTSVTIPNSVAMIGTKAFEGCTSLTSVTIPNKVTTIGNYAFGWCTSLTSVTIPNKVTAIGEYTFAACHNLISVTIGDSVTEIGDCAFAGCINLAGVTIPKSVTKIGEMAFDHCGSLTDVYYAGSESDWSKVYFNYYNDPLRNATIHYNSTTSAVSVTPAPAVLIIPFREPDPIVAPADPVSSAAPAANIAHPSTQEVDVDGQKITFQCYALKDGVGMTNYIKVRDLADILNGSAAQFQVGWDGNITITTGQAYTKNGSEQNTPFSGERTYEKTAVTTLVNGQAADLDTFQLKDDNGGGYTYYKLRDLGKALGITVDWTPDRGIYIETK